MMKGTDYPLKIAEAQRLTAIAAITRGPRSPSVDSKLLSILAAPPQASQARGFLFQKDVPIRVLSSFLHRPSALWGRYE